jgi:flagellar hook assembly protein FlgD
MKTKSLFLVALIAVSTVAFAGKDEPRSTGFVVVPMKDSEIFKVIYQGENSGKVKLNIYNAEGKLVMAETINKVSGFICPVNFAGLAFGEYAIELIDATGKRVEKINYQPSNNIKNIHISKVKKQGGFLLSVMSSGNEEINVRIYDNDNNLVHTESNAIKGNFAQLYRIEKLISSCTFEITDKAGNLKTVKF